MTPDNNPEEALPPSRQPDALPSSEPAGELPPPGERFLAKPAHLPEPTYWPFFLAIGVTFIGWGLISTWLIAAGGLIVFIVSLVGWINNLRHE
ncbi:MAG TPA: hypothetical protein VHE54_08585 [Puia sp.]|nr:hypothetical protein [Puia sp.]